MASQPDFHSESGASLERDRLTLALAAARMGTFDWDMSTNHHDWSRQTEKLFGFEPGEFQGELEQLMERIHPEDREYAHIQATDAIREHREYFVDYRVILPNGEIRWIANQARPFYDENGQPTRVIGVCWDVTESKRTERTLRTTLKIRDEFLSIASHELKTPLTSMKLQVQMAKKRLNSSADPQAFSIPQVKKLVEHLDHGINRLSRLVDEMLDSSRIATGELHLIREKFSMADAAREAMENVADQLRLSGIIVNQVKRGELSGAWDRARIIQVLTHLLTNAIRYAPGAPIDLTLRGDSYRVLISVHDHGRGIAEPDQKRIFDRFERAISAVDSSGMGLGLYIAREIVEAHGGTIRVHSIPGEGSTFMISLPKQAPATRSPTRFPNGRTRSNRARSNGARSRTSPNGSGESRGSALV